MPDQVVQFEGSEHHFPPDFTQADIVKALKMAHGDTPPAQPHQSFGEALWDEVDPRKSIPALWRAVTTPGDAVQGINDIKANPPRPPFIGPPAPGQMEPGYTPEQRARNAALPRPAEDPPTAGEIAGHLTGHALNAALLAAATAGATHGAGWVAENAGDIGAGLKGAVRGAKDAVTAPVTVKGISIPGGQVVAGAAGGGAAASAVGFPKTAGAVVGGAAPIVRGAVTGARAAIAERAAVAERAAIAERAAAATAAPATPQPSSPFIPGQYDAPRPGAPAPINPRSLPEGVIPPPAPPVAEVPAPRPAAGPPGARPAPGQYGAPAPAGPAPVNRTSLPEGVRPPVEAQISPAEFQRRYEAEKAAAAGAADPDTVLLDGIAQGYKYKTFKSAPAEAQQIIRNQAEAIKKSQARPAPAAAAPVAAMPAAVTPEPVAPEPVVAAPVVKPEPVVTPPAAEREPWQKQLEESVAQVNARKSAEAEAVTNGNRAKAADRWTAALKSADMKAPTLDNEVAWGRLAANMGERPGYVPSMGTRQLIHERMGQAADAAETAATLRMKDLVTVPPKKK